MGAYWNLQTLWFGLIAVLWMGYFFLEGFDFGVGVLLPFLGHNDAERRQIINTIGPVWDGNEVWLIVAGGATFAAFPNWYATMFSGFYLALFLILLALILRAVAIEWRGRRESARWRTSWDGAILFGSAVPAVLWGVAFANFVNGVPIDRYGDFTGSLLDLLGPYALLGGIMTLSLFILHGALFLALKTDGQVAARARIASSRAWWAAVITVFLFLTWSYINAVTRHDRGVVPDVVPLLALAAIIAVGWLRRLELDLSAFLVNGLAIVLVVATIFLNLYPRVLISTTNPAYSLTVFNSSSSHYTLVVMSVVALFFVPFVLAYQAWTYWVFRKRVSRADVEPRGSQTSAEGAALSHP
jgi:cytochrome d ubiquinol oxidase subunit II